LLVIWPNKNNDISNSCHRAIQCALDIQSVLNNKEIGPNKKLSVKIGIGVGECRLLVVGGLFKRCEYLAVGEGLRQACESETKACNGGETICSDDVRKYVYKSFEFVEIKDDSPHGHSNEVFWRVTNILGERLQIVSESYLMRKNFEQNKKLKENFAVIKTFIPAAVSIYLEIEKEIWSKEIRMLTIMFLNLKVDLSQTKNEAGLERIQEIVRAVQRSIYRTRGGLNKFLMDDKGSVMLLCWGLPPMSHPDDYTRSVLSALTLIKELKKLNCGAFMGITTGTCFTGVCGTIGNRREYSLLGEIVNLSARFMQKAIYHGEENKLDYCVLVDEKTKQLIQNKITCECIGEDELKGFAEKYKFYAPITEELLPTFTNPFPLILTHRNNYLHKNNQDSLYIIGRDKELEIFTTLLNDYIKQKSTEVIVIRGFTGSGKSLLIRKGLSDFLETNKELKNQHFNNQDYPCIFTSHQTPLTYTNPMNGFNKIFKKIYHIITATKLKSAKRKYSEDDKTYRSRDTIGDLLIKSESCSRIRYIEEILKTDLSKHYETNTVIPKLPLRDEFFESRKIIELGGDSKIVEFFVLMVKKYKEILELQYIPGLIFVIEDTQYIDELSIEFIKSLRKLNLSRVIMILSYQDKLCKILKNPYDKMHKACDIMFPENTIYLENILDLKTIKELIINHMAQNDKIIKTIDTELIKILISKSFKGIPLFILDIFDNLLNSKKYIQQLYTEIILTSELIDMEDHLNWTDFTVPVRIEKIIGSIIDQLSAKEIIILKCASVIGNIFDIQKLTDLNSLNLTLSELYIIISQLEKLHIIEFLYDFNPKHLVCKFSLPFLREILYQRMLIEQRTEIHNNIAKTLQTSKVRYMSYKMEVKYLHWHLRTSEKTLMAYLEEEDNTKPYYKDDLNLHNIKIFLIKDIMNRLNSIELRLDSDEIGWKNIPCIKSGVVEKKSDKGPTWEDRWFVISHIKLYYWYYEKDYKELKQPLGYFYLKDINEVKMLNDNEIGGRHNLFKISVTTWFKKETQRGPRNYFFSVKNREELINWVISLNFLRVKVTYDEFSKDFGMINLPLQHETKKHKKTEKYKFHPNSQGKSMSNISYSSSFYQSVARKNTLSNYKLSSESSRHLLRQSVNTNIFANSSESQVELITRHKNSLKEVLAAGMVITVGYVQEIIFSDEVFNEEMCFCIPNFLKDVFNDSEIIDTSDNDHVFKFSMLDSGEKLEKNNSDEIHANVLSLEGINEGNKAFDGLELSFDNKKKKICAENREVPSSSSKITSSKAIMLVKSDTFSLGSPNNASNQKEELRKERNKLFKNDKLSNTKYDKFIRPFSFGYDGNNNPPTDDEKKETNEEDEIYIPSIPVKTKLIPKYNEPEFDYLKKTNNIYKPYSSKLFQNLK
jgi:class 3 adenylate cyclase